MKDKIGSVTVLFRGSQLNFPDTNEWTKTILEWLTWIGAAGSALIAIITVFVSEAFAKQVPFTITIVLGVIFGLAFYYRCRQHGYSILTSYISRFPCCAVIIRAIVMLKIRNLPAWLSWLRLFGTTGCLFSVNTGYYPASLIDLHEMLGFFAVQLMWLCMMGWESFCSDTLTRAEYESKKSVETCRYLQSSSKDTYCPTPCIYRYTLQQKR